MKTLIASLVALFLSVGLLFILSNERALAQEDITPPSLLDVRFDPKQIDTSQGPVTITVTARAIDNLSGVAEVGLFFRKPGTTQETQIEFRDQYGFCCRVSGDALDGYYQGTITLPQYAAYGKWELYYVLLEDNVGNRVDIWKPDDKPEDASWPSLFNGFVFSVAKQELAVKIFMPLLGH